jgi:methionyl aminopeptidase
VNLDTEVVTRSGNIRIHDESGFEGMRRAGRLVASCLDMIAPHVQPGVTTEHLDDLIREFVLDSGAVSATIGYRGYKHASCISLNHVVCHGIPGARVLKKGDILNIDVTVIVEGGWHGDSSRMYVAGEAKRKAARLIDVTYEAMIAGIATVKPGARVGDIGGAISAVAAKNRVSVVEDFCGHGLGQVFHDAPNVVHSARSGTGEILKPGMFFTVEPMLNIGKKDCATLSDGWTAVTRDRSLSAQFEHSVGVTETGVEIFTLSPTGLHTPHNPSLGESIQLPGQ